MTATRPTIPAKEASDTRAPIGPIASLGVGTKQRIGRVHAVVSSPAAAATGICELAHLPKKVGIHVHLVNAYTIALADKHPEFADVLSGDSINLPDGKPLSWISRIRRDTTPLTQVRGPQFFLDVFDAGRRYDLKHFLLGSTEEVLEKLRTNLSARYPGIEIVGTHSPPFRMLSDDEYSAQDEAIARSGAHIVWVGLGTPKQDYESKRLALSLPIIAVAVGAAFDFTAGTAKEAPRVFTKFGFEWVFRLTMEPRRLWRRYVFGNARFIGSSLWQGKNGRPKTRRGTAIK